MKRATQSIRQITQFFSLFFFLGLAFHAVAQSNLLYNGDFELTTSEFYYDGIGATNKFALLGWEAFNGGDDSSWVDVSYDKNAVTWVLDLSGSDASAQDFVGLVGLQTAVSNRVPVSPGTAYFATVTYDNYADPAGISYFIDWFNPGGSKVGSAGGALDDPNGDLIYAPYTQRLVISGKAPSNVVRAGVRFQSSNGLFIGASADNFMFGVRPSLSIARFGTNVVVSWSTNSSFVLQTTDSPAPGALWTNLGSQSPYTNSTSATAFFRLSGP